jgi:hypothetical protein
MEHSRLIGSGRSRFDRSAEVSPLFRAPSARLMPHFAQNSNVGCCFGPRRPSIANKFAGGTMTAHFFLASLVAIGWEQVTLEEI